MAERFDLSFSLHSLATTVELLHVHYLLKLMYLRILGALTLSMPFNSPFHVLGVSSVIATIFAEKDVDIVRHPSSTHSQ